MKPNVELLRRALPTFLTCIGSVGIFATAYLTYRGTKKAVKILDAQNEIKGEKVSVKEEVKQTWTCYIPALVSGTASAACIFAGHAMNVREIAALTMSLGYVTKNRDKLEEKLKDAVGEEKYNSVKRKILDGIISENNFVHNIEETGYGHDLCFEAYSGRFFYSSPEAVNRGLAEFIQQLEDTGCGCLNDLYDYIGIEKTHFGWAFGYAIGDTGAQDHIPEWDAGWIDYENKGFRVYCIEPVNTYKSYGNYPIEGWQEY